MLERSPNPRQRTSGRYRGRGRPERASPIPESFPPALRPLLFAVLVLGGLVLVSRLGSEQSVTVEAAPASDTALVLTAPPPPPPPPRAAILPVAQPPAPTPTLDLLVRLESLRRLQRGGSAIYVDSLLLETDSLLRRWRERPGETINIALARDSFALAQAVDERPIRDAFAVWEKLRIGLRFAFVPDTGAADIVVRWIDRFETEARRTGQTDLEMLSDGAIQHASITLALHDSAGAVLERNALLTTALHEVGHALGLGHSARRGDIMFPSPTRPVLSDRDRRTVEVIYGLPPGSVRGGA